MEMQKETIQQQPRSFLPGVAAWLPSAAAPGSYYQYCYLYYYDKRKLLYDSYYQYEKRSYLHIMIFVVIITIQSVGFILILVAIVLLILLKISGGIFS